MTCVPCTLRGHWPWCRLVGPGTPSIRQAWFPFSSLCLDTWAGTWSLRVWEVGLGMARRVDRSLPCDWGGDPGACPQCRAGAPVLAWSVLDSVRPCCGSPLGRTGEVAEKGGLSNSCQWGDTISHRRQRHLARRSVSTDWSAPTSIRWPRPGPGTRPPSVVCRLAPLPTWV